MLKKGVLPILLALILATAISIPVPVSAEAASLGAINPPIAYNQEGTTHTISVTVSPAIEGVPVVFVVIGANTRGSRELTDTSGTASLTYTGTRAGIDSISAFIDTNDNGFYDAGEPQSSASAIKYWLGNSATGGGNIKNENGKVQWTFAGNVGFISANSPGPSIPVGKFNIVDHDNKISYHFDDIDTLIFWGDDAYTPPASNNMLRFMANGTSNKDGSAVSILVIIASAGMGNEKGNQISVYKLNSYAPGASYIWWFGGIIGDSLRFVSYFVPAPGPIAGGFLDGGNFQVHDIQLKEGN